MINQHKISQFNVEVTATALAPHSHNEAAQIGGNAFGASDRYEGGDQQERHHLVKTVVMLGAVHLRIANHERRVRCSTARRDAARDVSRDCPCAV